MKKCSYCGRLSDDDLTTCPECRTALPRERFDASPHRVLNHAEVRARRRAWFDAILWMVLSPRGFGNRLALSGLVLRTRSDYAAGYGSEGRACFRICLIASLVFAVLAVRSFR